MPSRLIIIRGNSGSGKSTVAKLVQAKLGETSMLVQQDVIRREMLFVKDRVGNPAINLIKHIVTYGKDIEYDVVLEGILSKKLYGDILNDLLSVFGEDNTYAFYMDVSFEETFKRHQTKPNKLEYGYEKMKEWWIEKDYLSIQSEKIIPESTGVDEAVDFILGNIE